MQTIGERLEDARKRKGISIREAAEATKIRGDYLQRFEGNQFDLGLAEIYVKGFLRSYAHFLGLPADRIINDFNGLGLGSGSRPRTPSREVYGRMDLSVATTEGSSESAAPSAPEASPAPARSHPGAFALGGGNLHQGSQMDPAVIMRIATGAVALLVVVLIIWGVKSMISDGRAKKAVATTNLQVAPESTITLVAVNPVSVQVSIKNTDGSPGEIILPNTPLARGEQRSVPWHSALFITATAGENLQVEFNGKRSPMPFKGYDRAALPAPSSSPASP